jgi:hypothetical protein
MKYLLSLFMMIAVLSACKKESFQSDLSKSRDAWQDFKKTSNNTYAYTVTTSSWAGFGASTTILVSNGIVSGREYASYTLDGQTGQKTTQDSWSESRTTLNSHQAGAAAITMDAVYDQAAAVWLKADVNKNTIYFETNNQGMISTCGYAPKECMDDCFTGIHITGIR